MNRIVLIGNGFDLAHNLPTQYHHFIDWYFTQLIAPVSQRRYLYDGSGFTILYEELVLRIDGVIDIHVEELFKSMTTYEQFEAFRQVNSDTVKITFKNDFLKSICEFYKHTDFRWVDIENIYFDRLKGIIKNENVRSAKEKVQVLNDEVGRIEKTLGLYLQWMDRNVPAPKPDPNIMQHIFSIIDPGEISVSEFNVYKDSLLAEIRAYANLDEQEKQDAIYSKKDIFQAVILRREWNDGFLSRKADWFTTAKTSELLRHFVPDYFLLPEKVLFLNFNYTYTDILYANSITKHLHIHGEINENKNNPIVLGYGDEFCEEYQILERYADNSYLGKIKSSRYLQTNNYREFLEFMESGLYQVIVMGHSCGNTDRTLLRTLFEHDNCLSIKPYYYVDKDGNDNYGDLTMSISRIFSDKAKMRDRVVNKTKCQPMFKSTGTSAG